MSMDDDLLLTDTSMQWLACLPGAVDQHDLTRTYAFVHPLNHRRSLARQVVSGDEGDLMWWIEFFNIDGRAVTDPALSRRVFRAKAFFGSAGDGPVAYNAYFRIADEFKRAGFASAVYDSEDALYRRWEIREVHISAHDEGLVVWIKKFGFLPAEPGVLAEDFATWSRLRREPNRVPAQPADYPDAFLRERGILDVYKVLS